MQCRMQAVRWAMVAFLLMGMCFCCPGSGATDRNMDRTSSATGSSTSTNLKYFSTRTAYEVVRNKHVATSEENIPGCRVEQVYMVIRHGTRFAGRDETEAMRRVLPSVQKAILSSQRPGLLSESDVAGIASWRMRLEAPGEMGIAPAGEAELFHVARRLRRRVPGLLSPDPRPQSLSPREDRARKSPHPPQVEVRCTDTDRSKLSARSFLTGLFQQSGAVLDSAITSHIEFVPHSNDRLLLFTDLCQKYIRSRLDQTDVGRQELRKFDASWAIPRIVQLIANKTGLSENHLNFSTVRTLYEACRFEYAILGDSVWCVVFPPAALRLLEFRQDLKYYWRYGHGKAVNYQPSCVLLKDILNKFRDKIDRKVTSRKAVFRVTHSRTLLPLLARLGMFNDSRPLLADNYEQHARRKWRLSRINPFAANIEFHLHSCTNSYFVRTFLNEREVQLPVCSSMWCPLEEVERGWQHIVDACDFDAMCEHGVRRPFVVLDNVAEALHTFDGG